jgi:8-oxo-dGTP diphosphatase
MDQELKLQVGVKLLLENKDGKFLLLRKNGEVYKTRNYLDMPGGRIDMGSSLMDNLKREIKEEIGVELHAQPELIFAQDIIKPEKGIHVVRLVYKAKEENIGEIILDGDHLEYVWMEMKDMKGNSELDTYLLDVLENCYA